MMSFLLSKVTKLVSVEEDFHKLTIVLEVNREFCEKILHDLNLVYLNRHDVLTLSAPKRQEFTNSTNIYDVRNDAIITSHLCIIIKNNILAAEYSLNM